MTFMEWIIPCTLFIVTIGYYFYSKRKKPYVKKCPILSINDAENNAANDAKDINLMLTACMLNAATTDLFLSDNADVDEEFDEEFNGEFDGAGCSDDFGDDDNDNDD